LHVAVPGLPFAQAQATVESGWQGPASCSPEPCSPQPVSSAKVATLSQRPIVCVISTLAHEGGFRQYMLLVK
jgi:hypothetical protein